MRFGDITMSTSCTSSALTPFLSCPIFTSAKKFTLKITLRVTLMAGLRELTHF